jgi:peptidyl-prolyl cis-trans isomerase A (cyclophilin A)
VTRAVRTLVLPLLLAGALGAQEDVQRTVRELLRKLRSDDLAAQNDAVQKLREIGSPAIPELVKAVQDPDPDYSVRARALLKAIGDNANPLTNPASEAMTKKAPDEYRARFTTSAGAFTIKVTRAWAPHGADRFYNLVRHGFFNDCRFFRVVANFVCQFGIPGDPALSAKWRAATIPDDPAKESNKAGRITFGMGSRANSRTTQVFINLKDNPVLDAKGFAPFGEVADGIDVVLSLYSEYGESAPQGKGPDQLKVQTGGNEYLSAFPKLDYVRKAEILE